MFAIKATKLRKVFEIFKKWAIKNVRKLQNV